MHDLWIVICKYSINKNIFKRYPILYERFLGPFSAWGGLHIIFAKNVLKTVSSSQIWYCLNVCLLKFEK